MRILIVGADGAIGTALAEMLRAGGHAVVGTTRRPDRAGQPGAVFLDLAAPELDRLPQADVTVICAAMARFSDCRTKPDLARQVNVAAPTAIAEQMQKAGKRVLLLSSSVVFDCLAPKRKANEPYAPRSAYGGFKADAERAVLALGTGMAVLRLTKILRANDGIFPGWIAALAQGRSIAAFGDHALCPMTMDAVTAALAVIVTRGGDGIFQVSGADDMTYATAARELTGVLGVPAERVTEVPAASAGLPADEVTPFTSLDTARLSALTGFVAPRARDVLREVYGPLLSRGAASAVAHG